MLKWVEINLKTLAGNTRAIKKALKPGVSFMAVVKADGYGHGAAAAGKAALENGADRLGVLTAEEGAALRSIFKKTPIHLLAPSLPEEAPLIVKHSLVPTIDSINFIRALDRAAKKPVPYHIDIDLGLGRWGVKPEAAGHLLRKTEGLKKAFAAGISAHLAYRPAQNMTEGEEKLSSFFSLAVRLRALAPALKAHAANSAILCDFPHWQLDMVRIGNLLYGIYPTDVYKKSKQGPPLPGLGRPWQFYARIISIRDVKKGESLGYAGEFTAPTRLRLATIPAGYSDGLTMEPAENKIRITSGFRYWGIINGKKAFFTGRTGIAHTMLDVTGIPEAKIGTPVALHVRRTAANTKIPRIYKK
ncbi:MAG: alanine racemase [Elusimicrobia bacterium CG_4_10_14_0_2_um_filter_56_8]|nr:MAG: alanine racemase [Elusimicrobia bacterium CG1_02_56_21]PJA16994.1 MAG: alanine racemase [Elusimicrobia bacterium CG_4_10_14_0_2_um_filter_56_8]